jgi:hypothetical protein
MPVGLPREIQLKWIRELTGVEIGGGNKPCYRIAGRDLLAGNLDI